MENNITRRTVDILKSEGHCFAAGALAASLGMDRNSYGCHFGMRSTIEKDRADYVAGWNACKGI